MNTLLLEVPNPFIFGPMQSANISPPLSASDLEPNPTFNVVIAYEDFETGKHAKTTYDFLTETLGRECHFSNTMWKFDVMGITKLREMAAKDAAAADIILVSCHGTEELPDSVKAWFEMWLAEKGQPLALVALFDCPFGPVGTREVRSYLADVARRGNMEFFAQPDAVSGATRAATTQPLATGGERVLSSLTGVLDRRETPFPRWGINE
ncbi:MAG TPA: hypothetical protein VLT36_16990 [Candidatus Dormibacteraeota bacterium]|nr:hypothetical protein [Candidatus Dormibacteraeota bacterium]